MSVFKYFPSVKVISSHQRNSLPVQSLLGLLVIRTVERHITFYKSTTFPVQIKMEKEQKRKWKKHCKQIYCKITNQGESQSVCSCVCPQTTSG